LGQMGRVLEVASFYTKEATGRANGVVGERKVQDGENVQRDRRRSMRRQKGC